MIDLLKIFLPVYAIVFVLVVVVLRIAIVRKQVGIDTSAIFGRQQGVHGLIGRYFKGLPLLSGSVIFLFITSGYEFLGPIVWLEKNVLIGIGLIVLVTTLLWIFMSQIQMGGNWRVGIDDKNESALVTGGLFSLSRNPIFLGIKLNALGFFLVLPNAVTLVILITGALLIDIQVVLEEEFLTNVHGDKYLEYCASVRRWV